MTQKVLITLPEFVHEVKVLKQNLVAGLWQTDEIITLNKERPKLETYVWKERRYVVMED